MKDEEKSMKKGKNIRSYILWLLIYLIFFFSLLFYFGPAIRTNLNEHDYVDILNEYRRILLEGERTRLDVALYSIEGIVNASAESKVGFTDTDHLRIEALLASPTEENLKDGLVSFIEEKTRLIGLSIRDDIAYVELSENFLSAPDLDKAKRQIEETLRIGHPDLRVAIIVDNQII